jgi:hypothetical protein
VCNFAIGQSTYASTHVKANLFYRGLTLRRPVFIGDTLTTVTKVVALKQNSPKPGRAATGLVALEITVTNQHSATVLHFYRCPMIACRDENAKTGKNDSLDAIPEEIPQAALLAAVPKDWRLDLFRSRNSGRHFADLEVGQTLAVESRDSVSISTQRKAPMGCAWCSVAMRSPWRRRRRRAHCPISLPSWLGAAAITWRRYSNMTCWRPTSASRPCIRCRTAAGSSICAPACVPNAARTHRPPGSRKRPMSSIGASSP